jgi:hypothetical protein
MSFRGTVLGAGPFNSHGPSAVAEPRDGAIHRGL